MIFINKFESDTLNWCRKISKDSSLWFSDKNLPVILKHEYKRLKEMFTSGQLYGAFLQMRDVLELVTKIPTIIAVSSSVNKPNNKEFQGDVYEILKTLLGGKLSFGHWLSIRRKLGNVDYIDETYKKILQDLIRCDTDAASKYSVDIAKWRNKRIGHGALVMEETAEFEIFQNEMIELLKLLKNHFQSINSIYGQIEFQCTLNGKLQAFTDDTDLSKSNFSEIWVKFGKDYFPVNPFMEIISGRVYLFDTFLHDKNQRAEFLDYVSANKLKCVVEKLQKLYEILKQHSNFMNVISDKNQKSNRVWTAKSESEFQFSDKQDIRIKPYYLINKIENFITTNKKGIFILRMMGGMGKTTLVKMLDSLSFYDKKDRHKISGISVRAYYIHDDYSSNIRNFCTNFEKKLMKTDDNEEMYGEGYAFSNKSTFTKSLNHFQKLYEESADSLDLQSKLLVIIDGLDEVREGINGESILDFIPSNNDLAEGVYILLTARTPEEIPANLESKISAINFNDQYTVTDSNKENKKIVDSYIQEVLKVQDEDILQLMKDNVIDNRILYAGILRYVHDVIDNFTILDIQDICKVFISKLRFLYTDKYFYDVKLILSLLALSDTPLTKEQVSDLLDMKINFYFLGIFDDISSLLEKNIHDGSTYYSISHKEYRRFIFDNFEKEFEDLQLKFWERLISLFDTGEKLSFTDWMAIYYALCKSRNIVPDLYEAMKTEAVFANIAWLIARNVDYKFDPESYFAFILCEMGTALRRFLSLANYPCNCFDENFGYPSTSEVNNFIHFSALFIIATSFQYIGHKDFTLSWFSDLVANPDLQNSSSKYLQQILEEMKLFIAVYGSDN